MVYTGFFTQLQGLIRTLSKAVVFVNLFAPNSALPELSQVWQARHDIGTMRADLGALR